MTRAARFLVIGGVLGAAIAVLTMVLPAAVGPDRWSYPLSPAGFVLRESTAVVSHILTALGILAVADVVASSRAGLAGVRIAAGALWLFAACEVAAAVIAGSLSDSVEAQLVGGLFGVASLGYAVGAAIGGIAIIRSQTGEPWARWSLLVSGVFVMGVVTPATLASNLPLRYTALALWSLMFCWMAPLAGNRKHPYVSPDRSRAVT
jgi:hypothetical protein